MPEEPTPDRTRTPEPVDPADHDRPARSGASAEPERHETLPDPDGTMGPDAPEISDDQAKPAQASPPAVAAKPAAPEPGSFAGTPVPAGHSDPPVWSRNAGTAVAIADPPHRGSADDQLTVDSGARPPGRAPGPEQWAPGHPGSAPPVPPRRRRVPYPAGVLPAAGVAGLVAAATVSVDRPGIGWLLAGSATAVAVGTVHRRAANRSETPPERRIRPGRWWAAAALALLAVGTFRAAGWLFVLCLIAAAVCGSLAVVGRPSARGVLHDTIAVPLASAGALAWVYAAQARQRGSTGARHWRLGASVVATVVILAVFVPLLAGADATFAAIVTGLVPRMDAAATTRCIVLFLLAGTATLGALYLLAAPLAPADAQSRPANRTLARLEWALPVGALTVLFASFLGAQLVALFGGDDYVQRTAGLTYAAYARSGFWQLAAVTLLTLAVILPVLRWATRDSATDRLWLRGLLCTISGLTLVIIASAFGRMWTYQQAYGFTVLRLLVGTCELWLGVVYLLVIVAVLRLDTAWLPRTTIATAVAALLVLAALNPEALVASENIDRWQRGEELDVDYLSGLSADIVPVLDRLPAPIRLDLRQRLTHGPDDETWNSWNLARMRAGE
ncbi:DUF4153 domain-containing protein [Nocardia africana]|uniref:DUF4153 domain-containing protein n=1 Tax=Nocardia africana TaxID=134964 RepID=UPI000AB8195E|nr:DUF4173 domain-containing protein [Nocardia africana]MCC3313072.1 DUF4173 domain-containing protein [Nocardia africana]